MNIPIHMLPKSNKKRANEKEARAVRQINSGAMAHAKGDIDYDNSLIEHKYTDKDYFKITKEILDKLKDECIQMNKEQSYIWIEVAGYRIIGKVDKI